MALICDLLGRTLTTPEHESRFWLLDPDSDAVDHLEPAVVCTAIPLIAGVIAAAAVIGASFLPLLALQSPTPGAKAPFTSFAVYGLSRASGVPAAAREVLRKARELVEKDNGRGVSAKVETERIGLEGETRLCAEYKDSKAAARAFEQVSALAKGVDLVNVVVEPCGKKEGKR